MEETQYSQPSKIQINVLMGVLPGLSFLDVKRWALLRLWSISYGVHAVVCIADIKKIDDLTA